LKIDPINGRLETRLTVCEDHSPTLASTV
jgi:hypothetical protein